MENVHDAPFFTNDAIILGLLMAVLAVIFYLESSGKKFWNKFFLYVPSLLLCYFVPALLKWPFNLIDGEISQLYFVASRYLLPAALILLCLSIDFKGIMRLGPKAIVMFLAGTLGIIIGGPISLLLIKYFFPSLIPSEIALDELWKGMSTIAGSWIGGGANQTAMKEVFEVPNNIFGIMLVVDVIVANIWMGFLLYGANIRNKVNRLLKADNSTILDLEKRMEDYNASVKKIPTTTETFILMAVAFGGVALAHWGSDIFTPYMKLHKESLKAMNLQSLASDFFWLVVISTTIGLVLSFTKARRLEGTGATRWGSVFIYIWWLPLV